jgi:hypothetical protein
MAGARTCIGDGGVMADDQGAQEHMKLVAVKATRARKRAAVARPTGLGAGGCLRVARVLATKYPAQLALRRRRWPKE